MLSYSNPGTTRICENDGDCTAQADDTYCETYYDTCTTGVCMCEPGLFMLGDGTCQNGKELWGNRLRQSIPKCAKFCK